MKKTFLFLTLILFATTVMYASYLRKISFTATNGTFEARLDFDSLPEYTVDSVLGNVPSVSFVGKVASSVRRGFSQGDVDISVTSSGERVDVIFKFPFIVSTFAKKKENTIILDFIPVGISQKMSLNVAATKISIDFSGENGSTLGLAVKYLARLLNRNIIIDPAIAKEPVNITLSNVTPSEAFYDVLISSKGIGYAILPDGTYYIAPTTSLIEKVGKLGVGTYNNIVTFYNLSTTNVSSAVFNSLVGNLFGKDKVIDYIGSYAIVKATADQQKTIRSLMDFLKKSVDFSTVSWRDQQSEEDLEKLVTTMYPTVKLMYLPAFSTILMSGNAEELSKAKVIIQKYSEILSQNGPKVSVTFSVPDKNIGAFLKFSKSFQSITAYGSPTSSASSAVYIVSGPKKAVLEFEKSVRTLASTLTAASKKKLHFNFVMWLDKNSVGDLTKMLNIIYPTVKTIYFPSFGQLLFYGYDPQTVNSAVEFVKSRKPLQNSKVKRMTVAVKISSKDLAAVNGLLKGEFPTLFGTGTALNASTTKYVISGEASAVEEFVNSLKKSGLLTGESTISNVRPSSLYLREVPWRDSQSANDLLTLIKIKYPNLNAEYLKSLKEFVIYGVNYDTINEAAKFILSHENINRKVSKKKTGFVKIKAQDFPTVRALISSRGLQFFGPTKVSTSATVITIGISGTASDVEQTLLIMEDSGLALSEKAPVKPSTPASVNQTVVVHNGLISCNVRNYPLSSLVERVYSHFDKNVIFPQALQNVDLKLTNVTLREFIKALEEAYSLSFTGTNVIVVAPNTTGLTRVYQTSDDVSQVEKLASFVGGKTFVDQKKGMVVVSGLTPASAKELDDMVAPLLKARDDVEIEAKIVDVSSNDNLTQQIKTTLMTPQLVFDNGLKFTLRAVELADIPKFLTNFSDEVFSHQATMSADFSHSTGNASVLSAPVVTTQSGESANILIGSKYPYMVTTTTNGQQQQQLKFLDTGIQLTILPVVLPDEKILLTITIEVSDADWGHAVNGIPAVNTRSASMKVVISDGQTLMIGGLTKHSRSENVVKIPFLGDLPFIGQFFRSTTFQDSVSNLDIFITAKVEK